MKLIRKITLLSAGLVLAAVGSLNAQMFMHVNSTAKTVAFTGSDSGTLVETVSAPPKVAWQIGNPGVPGPPQHVDVTTGFNVTGNAAPKVSADMGANDVAMFVQVVGSSADTATISGTGVAISYASLSASQQSYLESRIGTTIPQLVGSGFGGLQVVPEPHEYALMAGFGLLGFGAWRRRHRRRA